MRQRHDEAAGEAKVPSEKPQKLGEPMGTLRLPVSLTDADRLIVSAEMSAAQTALEEAKAAKKAADSGFNESIKGHEATVHDRNSVLRSGVIYRDVEVEVRDDPETGKKVTWRLDTNVPVRAVDLDPDERQVLMSLPNPGATDVGAKPDATDEQRDATSPDEAESLRADRLAGERAERISAGVTAARERIAITSDTGGDQDNAWVATLQYGNVVLSFGAATAEAAADAVARMVTEILEAQEDKAATWDDVAAASKAEQDRQEVERLAAEQAKDEATTPKRGFVKGLQSPRKKKAKHTTTLPDGREVDPEVEAAALDAAEVPAPGVEVDPETGLAF